MIKDTLTPFVPVVATDPFHLSTLATRLGQLITRDEELALLLAGVSTSTAVVDSTAKHELSGDKSVTKGTTSGWLTRDPAYYRDGIWTSPVTFANNSAENSGRVIVYPSSASTVKYGTLTTTYTVNVSSGVITSQSRSAEELQYGTPNNSPGYVSSATLALGRMFDGTSAYAQKILDPGQSWKWMVSPAAEQVYVLKSDNSKISLNSALPVGAGEYMQIIPCADQRHLLVCTRQDTGPAAAWFLLEYTGTGVLLKSQGTCNTSILSHMSFGYTDQMSSYIIFMLESDLKTIWSVYCVGTTNIDLMEIGVDNAIRAIGSFPHSFGEQYYFPAGNWFPGMHADNGMCNVVFNDKVLKMSRLPHQAYDTTSGYLQFNGTTSMVTSVDNLAQFNFGTGDFCIEAIIEADPINQYMVLSTDLWSIQVTGANPGMGSVEVTCPGQQLPTTVAVTLGKPSLITLERFNGVLSLYVDGWKKCEVGNTSAFGTPAYLRVGGDSPRFAGKLYACRITSVARYKGEFQINEFVSGAGDSYWANTQFLLKVDIGTLYKRRELLDSRGKFPDTWSTTKTATGTYLVAHDMGVSTFSVVPMAFTPGVKITTSNYTSTTFQVNTFSLNGSSRLDSDFSCMVFLG